MKASGFTFIRNGVSLNYPFLQSIRSLLPLVDELIVNVPESSDNTLEAVRSLGDPKLVVFESDWDDTLREGGRILSIQSNRALDRCSGDWAIYLQADEVLHEEDYPQIRRSMELHQADNRVDGLFFRFLHFEINYGLVNPFRYRRQVRIIRNNGTIQSWGDACGFRKIDGSSLKNKKSGARVFHYGWVRPPDDMHRKNRELERLYHDDHYLEEKYSSRQEDYYRNYEICRPFRGSHPAVMGDLPEQSEVINRKFKSLLPYPLRPGVWRWLFKKWRVFHWRLREK